MIPSIKSEFRKLITVRSTFVLIGVSYFFILLFSFYIEGYKGNTGSPASELLPTALQEIIKNSIGLGAVFASLISILFISHEYRYNTIVYTLTSNAKRLQVIISKIIAIVSFNVLYSLLTILVAVAGYKIGLAMRGVALPIQDINLLTEILKTAFYFLGYSMFSLFIATIARSVVIAIATFLIFSTTIEPLISSLLLHENGKYMPYSALDTTIGATMSGTNSLTSGSAIAVTVVYLVLGTLVTAIFFIKRDAN